MRLSGRYSRDSSDMRGRERNTYGDDLLLEIDIMLIECWVLPASRAQGESRRKILNINENVKFKIIAGKYFFFVIKVALHCQAHLWGNQYHGIELNIWFNSLNICFPNNNEDLMPWFYPCNNEKVIINRCPCVKLWWLITWPHTGWECQLRCGHHIVSNGVPGP